MLPSLLLSGDRDGAVQGQGCLSPSIPPSLCTRDGLSPGISSVTQGYVTRATTITTSWWLGHGCVPGRSCSPCSPVPQSHPNTTQTGEWDIPWEWPLHPSSDPSAPHVQLASGAIPTLPDTAVRCPKGTALVHTISLLCTSCCAPGCTPQIYFMASCAPKIIGQNSWCRGQIQIQL